MDGKAMELGHTGRLLENALVLYDKASGARFCQASGRCILGSYRGRNLTAVPAWILPWGAWRALFPQTRVMVPPEGTGYDYTQDVYAEYHASDRLGIHPLSRLDKRVPGKAFVLGVEVNGAARCWTTRKLAQETIANDAVGGEPVVVAWDKAGRWGSCLGRKVDGRVLTFAPGPDGTLADDQGGRWDMAGRGVSGHALGKRLQRLPARVQYWFSFQAHYPDATVSM